MEVRLDNKVVLVTGATHGIGRAIAETLTHSGTGGMRITGREPLRGNEGAASLSQAGTRPTCVAADLAEAIAPGQLVQECGSRFGRIDGLFNAAGFTDRWLRGQRCAAFRPVADARHIASLAVFLLSAAAGPMTGAVTDQEQSGIEANR